ncbi:MAG: hypothetical protein U1F77_07630 [Kiritimatiellia bacterium]
MRRAVLILPLAALLAAGAPAPGDPPRERILLGLSLLETSPEKPGVLVDIARAYIEDGNPVVAVHYLTRALAADPANPDAPALLDVCRTRILQDELRLPANHLVADPEEPGFWRRIAPSGWQRHGSPFWVASGWVSKLYYHGSTARESADIGETSLRAGKIGAGHMSLGAVRTGVRMIGTPDETQWEGKVKAGFFATDRVLAHAGFTWVDSSTTDPGATWVAGAGAEMVGLLSSKPAAFGFFQHRPDGEDRQVNLALEQGSPAAWLKLSVSTQASDNEDTSGTDWSAFPRAEVGARVSPAGSIALAAGAGRMTHEVRGFHDVLYNQDDAHVNTASIRLSRTFTGGVLEWTSGVDGYEGVDGGNYQAVSHVLALHVNSGSHQMPAGPSGGWTFSAGARSRGLTFDWRGDPPEPLIGGAVAPIRIGSMRAYRAGDGRVLYEDGVILPDTMNPGVSDGRAFFGVTDPGQVRPAGPYYQTADFSSRELRYSLRDDLPGLADRWSDDSPGGALEIGTPAVLAGGFTLSAGLNYAIQQSGRRRSSTATQDVIEQETRNTFHYPVSAEYWVIHDLDAFTDYWKPYVPPPSFSSGTSTRRRVYASYDASIRRQLDVTLHDLGFRLVIGRAVGPVRFRAGAGPVLEIAEGNFQDEVTWVERGKTGVLQSLSRREHDRDLQTAWNAAAAIRWTVSETCPWFLELAADYTRDAGVRLSSSSASVRLDREEWGGTFSVGIKL